MTAASAALRLTVYVGEDKMHGAERLSTAILRKARELGLAGTTVFRGVEGFGHDGRLRTIEVLASEDLPVVIQIIDSGEKILAFRQRLQQIPEIGLITCETIEATWPAARRVDP
jgi:PII-like signaling protein